MNKVVKWNELAGLFFAAGSTLLLEVTLVKIFGYSLWTNYIYLIISTAMFGLGFGGIMMMCRPHWLQYSPSWFPSVISLLCGVGMLVAFFVVNAVPIHLPDTPDGLFREIVNVGIYFLALALPFFFFGLLLSFILERRAPSAGIYYGADLVGAGLGCVALVPLIPIWEPEGLVFFCVLLMLLSAGLFAYTGASTRKTRISLAVGFVLLAVGTVIIPPIARDNITLNIHVSKRYYKLDQIENSAWSALSRIDIQSAGKNRKVVWIDGGINESSIHRFDGDFDAWRADREPGLERAQKVVNTQALPHLINTDGEVLVIGTSGGGDSLNALRYGNHRKVVGVDMDPRIIDFVTKDYAEFAGNLFNDGIDSEVYIDEGRSFVKRTDMQFDVIQMVNNCTPIAFQKGALNLSETFLLTVESFKEFYDSLTPDGILAMHRHGAVRMLTNAVQMFREMGMPPEEYSQHLVVTRAPFLTGWVFMMKKSPFTPEEIQKLDDFFAGSPLRWGLMYAPHATNLPSKEKNIYWQIATSDNPEQFYRQGPFRFAPSTDDKPFFNHWKAMGVSDKDRKDYPLVPEEMSRVVQANMLWNRINPGDIAPIIVMFEALILSTVFFGLPLLLRKQSRQALRSGMRPLGFFACLGIAFIVIEICLIQRLVLFLGAPVYSISAVLGGLLVSAGIGSMISNRLNISTRNIFLVLWTTTVAILVINWILPMVMSAFLHYSLPVRMLVGLMLVAACGLFMGMPMPIGIRMLKKTGAPIIPWAWAMNGYFTVFGSALSVILAINFGFSFVFYFAVSFYALAPFFFLKKQGAVAASS